MPTNLTLQKFYQNQYKTGEDPGPWWYQLIKPYILCRETVAANLLSTGKKLLDVGCGEGNLCFAASSKYEQIIGIDIAKNRISLAKKNANLRKITNCSFSVANFETSHLRYKTSEFDAITCISVLQYLFDLDSIVSDFYKLLVNKGVLIIEVPNVAYLPERLKLLCGNIPAVPKAIGYNGGVLHYFTLASLCQLLSKHGFCILQTTGTGILANIRDIRPSLLTGDILVVAKKES